MKFFRLRLVASLLLGITLISVASTYFDVLAHRHTLRSELARRTQWFGASLQTQIEQQFLSAPKEEWPAILERLRQHPDQPSLAVFNNNGQLLASAGNLLPMKDMHPVLLNKVLTAGKESSTFVKVQEDTQRGTAGSGNRGNHQTSAGSSSRLWYEDVIPLHSGGQIVGALLMLVDADYIRTDGNEVWQRSFLRIAALVVLVVVVTLAMVRWFLLQPLTRAAEWLRRLRHGEAGVEDGANVFGYLLPLAKEVNFLTENLTRAREAAVTEARLRDAAEHVWTADRLAVHVRQRLGNGKIFVVSNREPYMHVRRGGTTECIVPPSGLVTAIDNINVRSATLPNPSALEAIMRNGSIVDFGQFNQTYRTTYQQLPAVTDIDPGDRQRVDMSDALAMDTLKTLKASDDIVNQTLQASQIIEDEASQAAPGSAAYLTGAGIVAAVENQAMMQRMLAAELREEAAILAHTNAIRKRQADMANQFGQNTANLFK